MESHRSNPSHIQRTRSEFLSQDDRLAIGGSSIVSSKKGAVSVVNPEPAMAAKPRRLIADQRYCGLEALAINAGSKRMFARLDIQKAAQTIDVRSLSEDFRLDAAASRTFLSALLAGGLVRPMGNGGYQPTPNFREYALAYVVAPLSRERARALIGRAGELAERINTGWSQNRYLIERIAVSGSYMSRCDPLPQLDLGLILRKRPQLPRRHSQSHLGKEAGARQIVAAMQALSSFVVAHVAPHLQEITRPFSLVFEADENAIADPVSSWDRIRELSASISQRLNLR